VEGDLALLGIGWALERIPSATGLSRDGNAIEAAMRMAVAQLPPRRRVDAVVVHAPGSVRGDQAERAAVSRVFGDSIMVCSTKHLTGHTYGASGMVSLAMAQSLVSGAQWAGFPYPTIFSEYRTDNPQTIAINTAGFGGNSITVVVGKA
jgi:3-oxoacyl-(acyl-carrier-protein) synthase